MSENRISTLKKLVDEGEKLIDAGLEIPFGTEVAIPLPIVDWLLKCNAFLTIQYGRNSEVLLSFKEAYTLRMSVNRLVALAAEESKVS